MPPLRQAFDAGGSLDAAGGSHFSFAAPSTKKSHGATDEEGGPVHGTWIQWVKGSYGYFSRSNDPKPGAWAWASAGNRRDTSTLDGEELKGLTKPEDDELSDPASPPMSGKARPPRLRPVFPSSQAQAMVRYRQEMMELVRGVPETAYELSLRDLVEVPRMAKPDEEEDAGEEKGGSIPEVVTGRNNRKKVKSGKKQILRSTSMDSGVFLLKVFFPSSLWGRRTSGAAGSGSKVSPKPVVAQVEKRRPEKNVDAEWSEGCGENSNRQRRKRMGCYPFSINKGIIRW